MADTVALRAVITAFGKGTFLAAVALHVAISLIAPGDAGTANALVSIPIFITILVLLFIVGAFVFPLVALLSWPFRSLTVSRPFIAALLSAAVGLLIGAVATTAHFSVGTDDFWSGPVVGLVYGIVWFTVVRRIVYSQRKEINV